MSIGEPQGRPAKAASYTMSKYGALIDVRSLSPTIGLSAAESPGRNRSSVRFAYPDVRYSESAESGYTVYFEGWPEEFTSEDEALDCFAFGLSPKCRAGYRFPRRHRDQVGGRRIRKRCMDAGLRPMSSPKRANPS
jgi:hypothetical protein